jgi:hypothetical protein
VMTLRGRARYISVLRSAETPPSTPGIFGDKGLCSPNLSLNRSLANRRCRLTTNPEPNALAQSVTFSPIGKILCLLGDVTRGSDQLGSVKGSKIGASIWSAFLHARPGCGHSADHAP